MKVIQLFVYSDYFLILKDDLVLEETLLEFSLF